LSEYRRRLEQRLVCEGHSRAQCDSSALRDRTWRTIDRPWLMNSIVVRNLRRMSMSSSVTAACTATSSVEQAHRDDLRRAGKGAGDADALPVLAALSCSRHCRARCISTWAPRRVAIPATTAG
jgi:hypothetical protein